MTIVYNIILYCDRICLIIAGLLWRNGKKTHKIPSGDSESPGRRSAKNTP